MLCKSGIIHKQDHYRIHNCRESELKRGTKTARGDLPQEEKDILI